HRERAVRARGARLHRRGRPEHRQGRAGPWRHALPRRERRHAGRGGGPAAAGAAGGPHRARWRARGHAARRARRRRDETPTGAREEIAIDVRIIAATNRDLAPMIATGSFREDLYYRLDVVPIHLPALRDRQGDIEPLVRHFLRQAVAEGLPARGLSKDAVQLL